MVRSHSHLFIQPGGEDYSSPCVGFMSRFGQPGRGFGHGHGHGQGRGFGHGRGRGICNVLGREAWMAMMGQDGNGPQRAPLHERRHERGHEDQWPYWMDMDMEVVGTRRHGHGHGHGHGRGRRHSHSPTPRRQSQGHHDKPNRRHGHGDADFPAAATIEAFRGGRERTVQGNSSKKDEFELKLDVSCFSAQDLKVKTVGRTLIVEGRHEEADGTVTASLTRQFVLPDGVDPEDVKSTLTPDGFLVISAPAIPTPENIEREVPITTKDQATTGSNRDRETSRTE